MNAALQLDPSVLSTTVRRDLVALLERAQRLPLADYEPEGADLDELGETVLHLVGEGVALLNAVVELHERSAACREAPTLAEPGPVHRREVDRRVRGVRSPKDVADLAFVARLALQHREQDLRAQQTCPTDDRWHRIGVTSSAVRELMKSLSACDVAIAELDGEPAANRYFTTELERSLQTRLAYARLLDDVLSARPDEQSTLTCVRRCAIAFAKLVGRPVYRDLRCGDRKQVRLLQHRVLAWLRDQSDNTREGLRLWQDVKAFAELLQQVNQRLELVDHDRTVTAALRDELATEGAEVSLAWRERAAALRGRDRAVDEALDHHLTCPLTWDARLEAIASRLAEPEAPPASAAEATLDLLDEDGDFF